MGKNYNTLSDEALAYMCALIRNLASVSDGIDDINLRTDGTFSSVKIDNLIKQVLADGKDYADQVCSALVKLTCTKTTTLPTLDNSELNVIYLYSADGNAPYEQYLKISDTELINMGSTTITLDDYYDKSEADAKFALQSDVTDIINLIGTASLETTNNTLKGAINEVNANKVNVSDIVDNLESTDTDKPLSANQGKELKEMIGTTVGGNGKSAYQVAVDNGFTGTETEWLASLKGETGVSIVTVLKDDDDYLTVVYSDGTSKNIGQINRDVSADFLIENGFGNLRYYNGHLQYYNKATGTWTDTSVTPDNVYIMNMAPQEMKKVTGIYDIDLGRNKLKFEEPDDTVINDQVACVVEKVIIRRKLDSVPTDENDGELVEEVDRSDFGKYKKNWYIDETFTPTNGENWYYKIFPKSTTGFCNASVVNQTSIECKDYYLFGFKIDQNESEPASMITYIEDNKDFDSAYMNYTTDTFEYGDWGNVWFIKNLKPCMLKYDGTVDYELDKNDYTKKLDGTASDITDASYEGNAMMGIPKTYWKIVDNGDDTANIYISNKKVDDDFHCWSHLDNNGDEIDYCYMPIYNGYNDGTRLRSLSGKAPMARKTAQQEITYAKSNNTGSDIIWYTELFNDRMLINLLLLLIGKSTDTKTVFGTGNNNSYVSASNTGIKNTGTMNTKGLFWGNQDNKSGVKVFGIEHWYGNIWRRIGGWINDKGTQKIKMTYGQSDGSTTDGYNETGSGYISIGGATPSGTSGGYISKMLITDNGLIPTIASGSATTYYCDGLWFNNSQVDYACAGCAPDGTSRVGALCSDLHITSSAAYWSYGAALSCKPLATT